MRRLLEIVVTLLMYVMFILLKTFMSTSFTVLISRLMFGASVPWESIFATHFGIWIFMDIIDYVIKEMGEV